MATPKLLRRRTSLSSKKGGEKNPYSDRGVEKFSELLAEIEEKKRLIYSQFNPEEVSVIRFVHAGNNKLKPVVVRANSSSKLVPNNKEFEPSKMVKMQEIDQKLVLEDQEKEELKLMKPEIVDPVGADDDKKEEEKERLSLMEVVKQQPWRNYKGIGGVILVLLLMVVFGRCLKNYYLVQLQAAVCPRIQNID